MKNVQVFKLAAIYKISFEKVDAGWMVACYEDEDEKKYYTRHVDNPHASRITKDDLLGHTLEEAKKSLAMLLVKNAKDPMVNKHDRFIENVKELCKELEIEF